MLRQLISPCKSCKQVLESLLYKEQNELQIQGKHKAAGLFMPSF